MSVGREVLCGIFPKMSLFSSLLFPCPSFQSSLLIPFSLSLTCDLIPIFFPTSQALFSCTIAFCPLSCSLLFRAHVLTICISLDQRQKSPVHLFTIKYRNK
ncbi:hypothetical protein IQ07DRAFT_386673 [Pyrenochaeta sp. DS3sAY3a]|nr:hypothetical protein IQ07DRAFT_386673 [Pyrenochaeta sp. DS3sAY3a]